MANYCCTVRTNYFQVKNPKEFRQFMNTVCGSEDSVELWERTAEDGTLHFGFGCYGGIAGVIPVDENGKLDEDYDVSDAYDAFLAGLQKHVAENDAVIIMEVGNEKLRYLSGNAAIITSTKVDFVDLEFTAMQKASEVLGLPDFSTRLTY